MNIAPYAKAIGAAAGGAVTGVVGQAVGVLPPETPWYGYLLLYAITIIVPAVMTYLAPKNRADDAGA